MHIAINESDDIRNALKAMRKKYKVTQKELAVWINISSGSILRYEKNYTEIPTDILVKIIQFFSKNYVKNTINLSINQSNETQNN